MRTITLPGVLTPPSDCWLLADLLRETELAREARVLDVFTGSGALAIVAALEGAREVTAIDVSRRAIASVRINARLNGVVVRAMRGDMFAPVDGEQFDVIVANPPYLPGPADLPTRGASRAWDAGLDGRALIDRLSDEAGDHLAPGGALLMVHSSVCGEQTTLERLRDAGLEPRVAVRQRGALGPILMARAEELEGRGLLEPGEREETMLVIEATKAA